MIVRRTLPVVLAVLLVAGCQSANQAPPVAPTASASPSAAPSSAPSAPTSTTTLGGKVYDEDLNPLSGVAINAQVGAGSPVTATTGADGAYSLALPAGEYVVTASKTGYTKRTQTVAVSGATTLDFGGLDVKPSNAFFLSTHPEIEDVKLEEAKPGGPMTFKIRFSEALTKNSQTNFLAHLAIETRNGAAFLRGVGDIEPKLDVETSWDEAGQVLTLTYDEPYLASGPTETAVYNLRLKQIKNAEIDPVTDENTWEDLRITDAEGNTLGMNRADFAFLKPQLQMIGNNELVNKAFGYSPAIRRWNLTHTSTYNFQAAKDTNLPGLVSVSVEGKVKVGANEFDVMTMRFTEPMRVVRDADETEYTRLDPDKDKALELLVVNVSKSENGSEPAPLSSAFKVESFRFSKTEPNVVIARFPSGAFRDMKWVEVTLGKDVRDPAGNKADPAKLTATGTVTNLEETN